MTVIQDKMLVLLFLFMKQSHLNNYNNHVQLESTKNTHLNVYKCILSLIKSMSFMICKLKKHFLQMSPQITMYQSLAFIFS